MSDKPITITKDVIKGARAGKNAGIRKAIRIVKDEASKQSYNPSSIDRILEKLKEELEGNGKN
jgi:hypothetical protein